MAEPTGARLRTINAFFDSPRFPIKDLGVFPADDAIVVAPAATGSDAQVACPPADVASGAPVTGASVLAVPAVQLFLPKTRTLKTLLGPTGLPFRVTADKAVTDIEVRLFEVLSSGGLRALGGAFRQDPGPAGVTLKVVPTAFARSKLRKGGKRSLRVVATVTGRDGAVGRRQVSFTVR